MCCEFQKAFAETGTLDMHVPGQSCGFSMDLVTFGTLEEECGSFQARNPCSLPGRTGRVLWQSRSNPSDQASVSLAASAGLLQNHLLGGEGKPRWQLNICKESGMFVFYLWTSIFNLQQETRAETGVKLACERLEG